MTENKNLQVRRARPEDGPSLCEILNEIILLGGTTALETPMTTADLSEHYINGPNSLTCFVAELVGAVPLGFQMMVKSVDLPTGWADVGTFTKQGSRNTGVGAALFEYTKRAARDLGITGINATIRADNHDGLLYYQKMGFVNYRIALAVPLKDGTPVNRIYKKYHFRNDPQ